MNPILSPGIDIVQPSGAYLLRDEFSVDVAAGSVHGTPAVPGPGTRTVVDTQGSKLWLASGRLRFDLRDPHVIGDPGLWLTEPVDRIAGRMAVFDVPVGSANFWIGWDSNKTEGFIIGFYSYDALRLDYVGGTQILSVLEQAHFAAVVLRASGAFYFLKIPANSSNWTLRYILSYDTTTPLYATAAGYFHYAQVSRIAVPVARWLPTPLVSDGFSSAFGSSDGLGHQEGIAGGIGAGGAGVVFSNAGNTWSVSAGKAINTPSQGSNVLANGDFSSWTGDNPTGWALPDAEDANNYVTEVSGALRFVCATGSYFRLERNALIINSWYAGSVVVSSFSGSPFYLQTNAGTPSISITSTGTKIWTGRAQGSEARLWNAAGLASDAILDDWTFKQLTLSELVSISNLACSDVFAGVAITRSNTNVQAGLALNWNSPTAPTSGVIVYLTGSTIVVDKCVAGTWSNVSLTAYTYSAGARLVVVKNGTEYRVYYNNALVVASTITDAGIITNTLHGLFSSDPSNSFDDLCIYATGSSGEHNALNAF